MISIIVPIYNKHHCLHVSVESVLKQKYGDFELILVDDGSTDSSFELCKAYEKIDPRIKAYSRVNSGVSAARNYGINLVSGEYITFLDADDELKENALELMQESAKHGAEVITFGFDMVKNKTAQKSFVPPLFVINDKCEYKNAYLKLEVASAFNSACARLYKTEFIKKNSLAFEEEISILEDGAFVYACLGKAKSAEFIPASVYNYIQASAESLVSKYHSNFTLAIEKEYESSKWITEHLTKVALDIYYIKRFNRLLGFISTLCKQSIDKKQKNKILKECLSSAQINEILSRVNTKMIKFKAKFKLGLLKKKSYGLIELMF